MLQSLIVGLGCFWVACGLASFALNEADIRALSAGYPYAGSSMPDPWTYLLGTIFSIAGGAAELFLYSLPIHFPRYRLIVLDSGARTYRLGRHRVQRDLTHYHLGVEEPARAKAAKLDTTNCVVQVRAYWRWETTGLDADWFAWRLRHEQKENKAPQAA